MKKKKNSETTNEAYTIDVYNNKMHDDFILLCLQITSIIKISQLRGPFDFICHISYAAAYTHTHACN